MYDTFNFEASTEPLKLIQVQSHATSSYGKIDQRKILLYGSTQTAFV